MIARNEWVKVAIDVEVQEVRVEGGRGHLAVERAVLAWFRKTYAMHQRDEEEV